MSLPGLPSTFGAGSERLCGLEIPPCSLQATEVSTSIQGSEQTVMHEKDKTWSVVTFLLKMGIWTPHYIKQNNSYTLK